MSALEISLLILAVTSVVCIIILTIFITKTLCSAIKLIKNINKATNIINSELTPVVKDLKDTLSGVSSLVKTADTRVKVINCALNGLLGATGVLGGKLKGVLQGVIEGFKAGVNLFKK